MELVEQLARLNRREFLAAAAQMMAVSACATASSAPGSEKDLDVQLGAGASLGGKRVFPHDNPWNQDISKEPVDPNSDLLVATIGLDKSLHPDFGSFYKGDPIGIPYVVVPGDQKKAPVRFRYADESDSGPYPIPDDAPIEGGSKSNGDRHVLVIDRDNWKLYELYKAFPEEGGWHAGSGAIFDLNSNKLRPAGWTSADAAGLPIFPGLVRYDEVNQQKVINHAFRFTCEKTRRGYVAPARHWASKRTEEKYPPMGMRVRLKQDFDTTGFPEECDLILHALKRYGMLLADNGADWFLGGAHDRRWNNATLAKLKKVKGKDFEVVKMSRVITG